MGGFSLSAKEPGADFLTCSFSVIGGSSIAFWVEGPACLMSVVSAGNLNKRIWLGQVAKFLLL